MHSDFSALPWVGRGHLLQALMDSYQAGALLTINTHRENIRQLFWVINLTNTCFNQHSQQCFYRLQWDTWNSPWRQRTAGSSQVTKERNKHHRNTIWIRSIGKEASGQIWLRTGKRAHSKVTVQLHDTKELTQRTLIQLETMNNDNGIPFYHFFKNCAGSHLTLALWL